MRTVNIIGAKGGQGTSTFAVALAVEAARQGINTGLQAEDEAGRDDLFAILSRPNTPATLQVQDYLHLRKVGADLTESKSGYRLVVADSLDAETDDSIVVLRADYLALRHLTKNRPPRLVGAVLFEEPGRALTAADVADVLGVPVIAAVPVCQHIARAADAGVLAAYLNGANAKKTAPLRVAAQAVLKALGL